MHRQVRPEVDRAYAELQGSIDREDWKQLMLGLERVATIGQRSPEERSAVNQ
jgi:hypothetical protein